MICEITSANSGLCTLVIYGQVVRYCFRLYFSHDGVLYIWSMIVKVKRKITFVEVIMLASLADLIEAYILSLVEEGGGVAEMQRAYLADYFRCVPSQITYVLSSRFQPERGYVVESKRGSGGYIRVVKIELTDGAEDIMKNVGTYLSQDEAYAYISRLYDEDLIDTRTFKLMQAVVSRDTLAVDLPHRDWLRARIFQAALSAYFSVVDDEE
jgi:transcriptional regulator CtsR